MKRDKHKREPPYLVVFVNESEIRIIVRWALGKEGEERTESSAVGARRTTMTTSPLSFDNIVDRIMPMG